MSEVAGGDLAGLLGIDREHLAALVADLAGRGLTVATAESLTAGLVAALITEIPGSSAVLRGGIVCYGIDLKHSLVGVDADLLARRGAVDPEVAVQLARGAAKRCGATIGIGLTGVAGPDPQDGIPAGTVFLAAAGRAGRAVSAELRPRGGPVDRWQVRAAAVRGAIALIETAAGRAPGNKSAAPDVPPATNPAVSPTAERPLRRRGGTAG